MPFNEQLLEVDLDSQAKKRQKILKWNQQMPAIEKKPTNGHKGKERRKEGGREGGPEWDRA